MEKFKIAIAEDDRWYAEMLKHSLSMNPDYEVFVFNTGKSLLNNIAEVQPSVVTVDFSLPDMEGDEVLKRIKAIDSDIEVIIVSGQDDISTAIDLLRQGAYDYLVKNEEVRERIWKTIINIRENVGLKKEVKKLRTVVGKTNEIKNLIKGNSKEITKVHNLINKSLETNINVSITGETGTGKELVAKAIHFNSSRAKKPFVAINVAAIPADLIESELFGHEKGAFTGAHKKTQGKIECAQGGTLFLDEIGDMPLPLQTRLLRVLAEGDYYRVGGRDLLRADERLIAATHQDLEGKVRGGSFREDLYHRLNVIHVALPPLRARREDIALLAGHFLKRYAQEFGRQVQGFSQPAMELMSAYKWPGNVRELENEIRRALLLAEDALPGGVHAHDAALDVADHDAGGQRLEDGLEVARHGVDLRDLLRQRDDHRVQARGQRVVGQRDDARGEDRGVLRTAAAGRDRRHRDAAGHLHGGEQRVEAAERRVVHRDADDRQVRVRGHDTREVRGAAGGAQDHAHALVLRLGDEVHDGRGRAMRRHDARGEGDLELTKLLDAALQTGEVGVGAHQQGDLGLQERASVGAWPVMRSQISR